MTCPYCTSTNIGDSAEGMSRPPDQQLKYCPDCGSYHVERRGKGYPLANRADPDSATVRNIAA